MVDDKTEERYSHDYAEIYTQEDNDNLLELIRHIHELSGIIIKEMHLTPLDAHKSELLKIHNQIQKLELACNNSMLSETSVVRSEENKIADQHIINIQEMFKKLNNLANPPIKSKNNNKIQHLITSICNKMADLDIIPPPVALIRINSIYSVPKDSILLQKSNNSSLNVAPRHLTQMVNNEMSNSPSSNLLTTCTNNITSTFNNTRAQPASTCNANDISLIQINVHKTNTPVPNQEASKITKFLYYVFEIYRFILIPASFFISMFSLSLQFGLFIGYLQHQQNISLYILQNYYVAMICAYFLIGYFGIIMEVITYISFMLEFCKNKCVIVMFGTLIEVVLLKLPAILAYICFKHIEHVKMVVFLGLVARAVFLILGIADYIFSSLTISSSFPRRDLFFNYIPRENRKRALLVLLYIIFFIFMYLLDILFLSRVEIVSNYNRTLFVIT
ncbi:hypothetical protein NEPAR04_1933 [Nematocida parisii]|nr:hypothetical protein NEPAR08_1515 [Nematocida parisii]KAI5130170.1 hypothetical protein NEPAR03_1991 [Nematocida parisii]KAI5143737.1 hypothetical protein NEPAR04_1933 [Nematocida parisii]